MQGAGAVGVANVPTTTVTSTNAGLTEFPPGLAFLEFSGMFGVVTV